MQVIIRIAGDGRFDVGEGRALLGDEGFVPG
jgi:hypothetical protein